MKTSARLAEHGWRGIGLDEAEAFLLKGAPLPPRSLLITFDDGYLDNYVYAWPILRKYGHKGVVFAVTERMEAEKKCRPTLAEVWEGLPPPSLPPVDAPMHEPLGYGTPRYVFSGRSPTWNPEYHGRGRAPARHLPFSGSEWGPEPPRQVPKPARTGSRRQRFHVPERGRTRSTQSTSKSGAARFKNAPSAQPGIILPDLVAASGFVPQEPARPGTFNRREMAALKRL
ncbi:MAG: polysaccharide deacetylase family protein [Bilophila wadsworthia]